MMQENKKSPASADTLTRENGSISWTETSFIIADSSSGGKDFTEKTAALIVGSLARLLGQQEGIEIKVSVRPKEAGGKTIA